MSAKQLGPYTSGEIPLPLVVTMTDADKAAIDISGYDARFTWRRDRDPGTVTERDAAVTGGPAGEATYTWVEDDFAEPGKYEAELWVGNGTNRLASERFTYDVRPALAVPAI